LEAFNLDDLDFAQHIDYIHYNLVKHVYVKRPSDWCYSSIHRLIKQWILNNNWGVDVDSEG
jgi:REP-associated tyrosine transposase